MPSFSRMRPSIALTSSVSVASRFLSSYALFPLPHRRSVAGTDSDAHCHLSYMDTVHRMHLEAAALSVEPCVFHFCNKAEDKTYAT